MSPKPGRAVGAAGEGNGVGSNDEALGFRPEAEGGIEGRWAGVKK
jgi:hypothetical protein